SRVPVFSCCIWHSCVNHRYHFVYEKKTWTEAQRYCRENYTDLATIDNMEEMNRLVNTANGRYSGLAWIGLYDDLDSWRWSLDDESLYKENVTNFRNWYIQKPVNWGGKSMCACIAYDGTWQENSCSSTFWFICYDGNICGQNMYISFNGAFTDVHVTHVM
uniref:C-type lectin domain-containing protein n=1 Tax=Pygocentrus nattereri TaxID=42514 RepID=A0AAR2KVG9_PYGNA